MNHEHKEHRIHHNSRASIADFDSLTRAEQVCRAYRALGTATDREVRDWCGYTEMNSVRPAITSLVEDGVLVEQSSTRCETTSRQVRLCRLCIGEPIPLKRSSRIDEAVELIREVRNKIVERDGSVWHAAKLMQAINLLTSKD